MAADVMPSFERMLTGDELIRAAVAASEAVWTIMHGGNLHTDPRADAREFVGEELDALRPALRALGIGYPNIGRADIAAYLNPNTKSDDLDGRASALPAEGRDLPTGARHGHYIRYGRSLCGVRWVVAELYRPGTGRDYPKCAECKRALDIESGGHK